MITLETFLLILFALAVSIFIIIFFFSSQMKRLKEEMKDGSDAVLMEWLKDMKSSVEKNSEVLEGQLKNQRETLEVQMKNQRDAMNQQTKLIWERLDNAQEVIKGVAQSIGGIQEFGKDLKDLSNILKSPKLRGGLGEQFLYDILANSLPQELFRTQYKFKNGETCDAVIFTDRGMIPVDSKFPMENFKAMITCDSDAERGKFKKTFVTDVKKRIDEIAGKYLIPEEQTTEQAVMYIPSESVFYELVVNSPQIEEYAKAKNVLMASPNTFSYFVKIIRVAYQSKSLEKHAGEILKALAGIKVEAEKFNDELSVLERHISNGYKAMDNVKIKFTRLFGKIEGAHSLEGAVEKEESKLLE